MNYFELFNIPVQLKIDKSAITKKYFDLSRQFHPDYFATAGDDAQAEALEQSALLNKAYKTFQNADEIIKYVLQLKGLLEEEEKYQLPPDFLMEVMDINEQLMDADDPAVIHSLQTQISQLENDIYEPVKEIVEHYQEAVTSEKELLQVKAYYYKKKYLWRIRQQLAGKL
ncbi:MAG: Fe-S protein assembly co-chaperone HscB [Bacteroidetes bacterium]|nr:Fe-S protein assembly co-chaperone HscB [Bacteroidota bacterium]